MISIYSWNQAGSCNHCGDAPALRPKLAELKDAEVLWIDLENPTEEEEQLVYRDFFPVHPLTLEDVTRLRRLSSPLPHFPKAEEFRDYLFVIVNPLTPAFLEHIKDGPAKPETPVQAATQLSAILTQKFLITHHYEPLEPIRDLKAFLYRHEAQADRGPDYLFHLVLDAMVDQYVPALDHFDDSLDEIEGEILDQPSRHMFTNLLHLKHEIIVIRKSVVYEREVLARLARGEFALIEAREMVYYRNVYDHLIRFAELIESSREMVTDLMQTHLAAASNKLNEIMKVLTMISTVVLPMTLIAGVYGMNFPNIPETKWEMGYPFALVLMAMTGLLSFVFFKWMKWF